MPRARPIIRACDLGTGPFRPFGAALGGKYAGRSEMPERITVRPIRPRASGNNGRCPECGDRYFGCGHDGEDE